jgi:hypothetical protein
MFTVLSTAGEKFQFLTYGQANRKSIALCEAHERQDGYRADIFTADGRKIGGWSVTFKS